MDLEPYTLIGIPLVIVALINLNILVCDRDIGNFINKRIRRTRWVNSFILFSYLFSYITGMARLEFQDRAREIQIVSIFIISVSLLVLEIAILVDFTRNGYRPGLSKEFFNYLSYITVLGLVFDKFEIPWWSVAIVSTLLAGCIVYFGITIWKYERISSMIVEYLDLYSPALGLRFFSTVVGLILISYGHSEGVFRGFVTVGSLVFAGTLWYSAFQMEKLLSLGRSM